MLFILNKESFYSNNQFKTLDENLQYLNTLIDNEIQTLVCFAIKKNDFFFF